MGPGREMRAAGKALEDPGPLPFRGRGQEEGRLSGQMSKQLSRQRGVLAYDGDGAQVVRVEMRECLRCKGVGKFHRAEKDEGMGDIPCGQCEADGFVWVEVAR